MAKDDRPVGKSRDPKVQRPENEYKKPRHFQDDEPIEAVPPESKSWDEHETLCRMVRAKADEIQSDMEDLFHKFTEFEGMTLKAYKKMPRSDAMFSDSPLSPLRMQSSFRQNLAKLGWRWAAGLPFGPEKVRDFKEVVAEACTWGMRILKDEQKAVKIEHARKLAEKAQDDIGKII